MLLEPKHPKTVEVRGASHHVVDSGRPEVDLHWGTHIAGGLSAVHRMPGRFAKPAVPEVVVGTDSREVDAVVVALGEWITARIADLGGRIISIPEGYESLSILPVGLCKQRLAG